MTPHMTPAGVNSRWRFGHCQGTLCNGMSVPCPDDEPAEQCECGCGHCMKAKGDGEEMMGRRFRFVQPAQKHGDAGTNVTSAAPEKALPGEAKLPDAMGWWARGEATRKGGRNIKWYYVQTFDDGTPPSVWVPEMNDFIPVEKFTPSLVWWWGPITVPGEEG